MKSAGIAPSAVQEDRDFKQYRALTKNMEQEYLTADDIQKFVEDLHQLLQQCVEEETENKVIRKVDRKKTKQINRNALPHGSHTRPRKRPPQL